MVSIIDSIFNVIVLVVIVMGIGAFLGLVWLHKTMTDPASQAEYSERSIKQCRSEKDEHEDASI